MNRVDAQRAELRDLNDLFASRMEARIDQVEARMGQVEAKIGQVEAKIGQVEAKMEAGFANYGLKLNDLRRDMEAGFARLESRIEQRTADIMKWSFVFWVGSVVTLVGALAALDRFLP